MLQLVVHKGLISQRNVSETIANARKIAEFRLDNNQTELTLPTNHLHQDIQTKWNSLFYMIQSLLEQKQALCPSVLKQLLSKRSITDSKIMKRTLLQTVDRQFSSIESHTLNSVATLLDPQYKTGETPF